MKLTRREWMIAAGAAAVPAHAAGAPLPPNESVQAVEVCRVPSYCEGVVFDHDGDAYISHGKFLSKIKLSGEQAIWAEPGAPNGHKILADGSHLVCNTKPGAILRLGADGKLIEKVSEACDGKPLRGPNDLSLDPKGGFYFTDPGGSSPEKPIGTVHYVDKSGKTHLVAEGFAFPNGIVLRPGGKKLLVCESRKNRILEFDVTGPGKVKPYRVFADLPAKQGEQVDNQPDGCCLDAEGNLFIAHYGMRQVQVLSPKGELIRRYPGGNLTTSNVAFGGPNLDQLFVTGGLRQGGGAEGGFFRLDLKGHKGLVILPKRKA